MLEHRNWRRMFGRVGGVIRCDAGVAVDALVSGDIGKGRSLIGR